MRARVEAAPGGESGHLHRQAEVAQDGLTEVNVTSPTGIQEINASRPRRPRTQRHRLRRATSVRPGAPSTRAPGASTRRNPSGAAIPGRDRARALVCALCRCGVAVGASVAVVVDGGVGVVSIISLSPLPHAESTASTMLMARTTLIASSAAPATPQASAHRSSSLVAPSIPRSARICGQSPMAVTISGCRRLFASRRRLTGSAHPRPVGGHAHPWHTFCCMFVHTNVVGTTP